MPRTMRPMRWLGVVYKPLIGGVFHSHQFFSRIPKTEACYSHETGTSRKYLHELALQIPLSRTKIEQDPRMNSLMGTSISQQYALDLSIFEKINITIICRSKVRKAQITSHKTYEKRRFDQP